MLQHRENPDTARDILTATHCSTLPHTATHCNPLQHKKNPGNARDILTATHCNTLQHTATQKEPRQCRRHPDCNALQYTATHCNTLQHRKYPGNAGDILTATHYNTLQHTATHCNTLQHTKYPGNAGDILREAHWPQHFGAEHSRVANFHILVQTLVPVHIWCEWVVYHVCDTSDDTLIWCVWDIVWVTLCKCKEWHTCCTIATSGANAWYIICVTSHMTHRVDLCHKLCGLYSANAKSDTLVVPARHMMPNAWRILCVTPQMTLWFDVCQASSGWHSQVLCGSLWKYKEWHTRVTHKSDTQEWHTRVTHLFYHRSIWWEWVEYHVCHTSDDT